VSLGAMVDFCGVMADIDENFALFFRHRE